MAKFFWEDQEAKNRFSELLDATLKDGPQIITRHGRKEVVVLSYADYRKMELGQLKLSAFFRRSPLVGIELDLTRDELGGREGSG